MPVKIELKLGDNTFSAEGDFTVDQPFIDLVRTWVNAQSGAEQGQQVEELTAKLNESQDALATAVQQHTPAAG